MVLERGEGAGFLKKQPATMCEALHVVFIDSYNFKVFIPHGELHRHVFLDHDLIAGLIFCQIDHAETAATNGTFNRIAIERGAWWKFVRMPRHRFKSLKNRMYLHLVGKVAEKLNKSFKLIKPGSPW
jgi:hypothetical protein